MVFKSLPYLLLYFVCSSCGTDRDPQTRTHRTPHKHQINTKNIIESVNRQNFSQEVKSILHLKVAEIAQAQEVNDAAAAKEHLFEYNRLYETEYSKAFIPDADLNLIDSKYNGLGQLRHEAANNQQSSSAGAKYNGLPIPNMVTRDPFVYNHLVLEQVLKVYKDYGRLYIKETKGSESYESLKRPWSGHWYPHHKSSLYKDKINSPLAKFDKLVDYVVGVKSNIRADHEKRMKYLGGTSWEGLCDAWAFASVVTEEPVKAKTIKGVHFSIADQKALLTFSHLKYPYVQYGIQYDGGKETDGSFDDIKPEAFHQVLASVIGKEQRAVVIDDAAGVEVWNKPLYKYSWRAEKDPENRNAYLVTAYAWLVKERTKETDTLTTGRDIFAPTYYYRLYVDKTIVKDGKYLVVAGEWIGSSIKSHPDNIKVPYTKGSLGSNNPEFNKNLNVFERYFLNS